MKMRIEIIPKGEKYEPYIGVGKYEPKSAAIDFQLMFHGLKDKQSFENVRYALTEAVANAIRDFEKVFNIGSGYL
jgi:hypothetical protein